jgi:hypothetical protein
MRQSSGLYLGINTSVQQFLEMLNDFNYYLKYFPEDIPNQLDQVKAVDPECHEVMVNSNIDIFEMSYEESVYYFNHLENLENIRCTNGPRPTSLPVDYKKIVSAPSSVGKCSKNTKESTMWCYYCGKNNHNTADSRAIDKFKQQIKARFEAKAGTGKKSLAFFILFGKINELKR